MMPWGRCSIAFCCAYVATMWNTKICSTYSLPGWKLDAKTNGQQTSISVEDVRSLQGLLQDVDFSDVRSDYVELIHRLRACRDHGLRPPRGEAAKDAGSQRLAVREAESQSHRYVGAAVHLGYRRTTGRADDDCWRCPGKSGRRREINRPPQIAWDRCTRIQSDWRGTSSRSLRNWRAMNCRRPNDHLYGTNSVCWPPGLSGCRKSSNAHSWRVESTRCWGG